MVMPASALCFRYSSAKVAGAHKKALNALTMVLNSSYTMSGEDLKCTTHDLPTEMRVVHRRFWPTVLMDCRTSMFFPYRREEELRALAQEVQESETNILGCKRTSTAAHGAATEGPRTGDQPEREKTDAAAEPDNRVDNMDISRTTRETKDKTTCCDDMPDGCSDEPACHKKLKVYHASKQPIVRVHARALRPRPPPKQGSNGVPTGRKSTPKGVPKPKALSKRRCKRRRIPIHPVKAPIVSPPKPKGCTMTREERARHAMHNMGPVQGPPAVMHMLHSHVDKEQSIQRWQVVRQPMGKRSRAKCTIKKPVVQKQYLVQWEDTMVPDKELPYYQAGQRPPLQVQPSSPEQAIEHIRCEH